MGRKWGLGRSQVQLCSILGGDPKVNRCIWTPAGGDGWPLGQAWACPVGSGGAVLLTMGWDSSPGPADTFLCEERENTGDPGGEDVGKGRRLGRPPVPARAVLSSVRCSSAGDEVHRSPWWGRERDDCLSPRGRVPISCFSRVRQVTATWTGGQAGA